VLVDIEPDYFTLDPDKLEAALSPHTKAIIPVHLYGQAADMEPILAIARRYGLRVIEDCARLMGQLTGNKKSVHGEIAVVLASTHEKPGGIGDGGMIVTMTPGWPNKPACCENTVG